MKKTSIAFVSVFTAAAPTIAHAQSSVALYGVVDAGILYKDHSSSAGSAWALGSGIESTSRWGLSGSEDLGAGLHATFQFESAFRVNNGSFVNGGQAASAGTILFDRGATVGLTSDTYGGMLAGKNRSPLYRTLSQLDVTGYSNFGSLNNLLYQNLSGYTGFQYSWVDNSVEYLSPKIGGFEGNALYSFGGVAGDAQARRVVSVGGSYRAGGFTAAAAYFSGNDATGVTDATVARAYTVGANYRWSKFRFMVDVANFKNPSKNTSDNYYTAEVAYAPTAYWLFTLAYIRQDDRITSKRDASLYKLGAEYELSKRTSLYSLIGYVNNNSLATLGIQNSTPDGAPGKNQLGIATGIVHRF